MSDKKPLISINNDQMTLGASRLAELYERLAQNLMLRMVQRIKERGTVDLEENPYLWHLQKLNDMHMLNKEVIEYVSKETGVAKKLLYQIMENEGLKVYEDTSQQLAEQLSKEPPDNYNGVKETLSKYADQTFRELDNYVNQTLLTTNMGKNAAMLVYQKMIEETVAEVTIGLKTKDKAISDVVNKWLDKGIQSSFIDQAGRRWNIDTYARAIVQSTTYRVYNEMRTSASEELGVNTFYYSVHTAARPACAGIQGKIVTKARKGFFSSDHQTGYVTSLYDHGYGEAGGCLGINCRHFLTPFIIGVNQLPDTEVPSETDAVENGKLQAKQRAYERAIREDKYKLEAAKILKRKNYIDQYQNKLSTHRQGLRNLIDDNEFLHRDYNREKTYKDDRSQKYFKEFEAKHRREYNEAKKKLTGYTKDGLLVKEVGTHFLDRIYDRNLTVEDVKAALKKPLFIEQVKIDSLGRKSIPYIGEKVTVYLNPDTGNIVTTHATSSRKRRKYSHDQDK